MFGFGWLSRLFRSIASEPEAWSRSYYAFHIPYKSLAAVVEKIEMVNSDIPDPVIACTTKWGKLADMIKNAPIPRHQDDIYNTFAQHLEDIGKAIENGKIGDLVDVPVEAMIGASGFSHLVKFCADAYRPLPNFTEVVVPFKPRTIGTFVFIPSQEVKSPVKAEILDAFHDGLSAFMGDLLKRTRSEDLNPRGSLHGLTSYYARRNSTP